MPVNVLRVHQDEDISLQACEQVQDRQSERRLRQPTYQTPLHDKWALGQAVPGAARVSVDHPRYADSIAAMSIFFIVIIASKARLAAARSELV